MQHAPQVPQGSSTPGETVLPRRQVNVLATCRASNHEYTLSEHTAVTHSADWLHLVTFPLMPYAPPWPQGSSTPGKIAGVVKATQCSGPLHWMKPELQTI